VSSSTVSKDDGLEKPIKVLALTRYARLGASTRLRCLQFAPLLKSRGIDIVHSPLMSDEYLKRYYAGQKSRPFEDIFKSFMSRLLQMLSAQKFDVVWLEKEALPFVPWFFESLAGARLPPTIVDYDDAIFHNYDMHPSKVVRWAMGKKIDAVMAHANIVVVGNK
jgi:hypothetical protein